MRRARLLALLLPLTLNVVGPATVSATGHLVRITSTLEPARLTVAPGDTVTFRNDDGDRHRMRSRNDAGEFDTGDLDPGESFRVRFPTAGTFHYIDERADDDQRYWGTIVVGEDGSEPTDGGDGGGGETSGGTGGGTSAPTAATITLADRVFRPRNVTIAAGGTVTWRNDDDREHTATATGEGFNSGVLATGETYRKRFDSAGTFPFLCIIHPEMTGTVIVTGSGSGAGGGPAGPAATPKPTPPAATSSGGTEGSSIAAARERIAIVDLDFVPREVEIRAGGTVTWTNTGVAPHTATADGGAFDSDQLNPGESFTQTFAAAGRFAYACAIHPSMTGVVVVRATSGAAAVATPAVGLSSSPGPSASAASASVTPSVPGVGAAAPPGPGGLAEAAGAGSAPTEPLGAGLVSTVLALALVLGALMVGAGLVLGTVRRGAVDVRG